jgi:hypothetical protein
MTAPRPHYGYPRPEYGYPRPVKQVYPWKTKTKERPMTIAAGFVALR